MRIALALGVLTGCVAGSAEASVITLAWDPTADPTVVGYAVSWGTTSGVYGATVVVGNQTTFLFTPPDPTIPYYFVASAYNSSGLYSIFSQEVRWSPDGTWSVTPATPTISLPTVTTGLVTGLTVSTAILNGTVNPNGQPAVGYFDYGLTSSYGTSSPSVSLGSGSVDVAITSGMISGLTCNTVYHYHAAAANSGGAMVGRDAVFTTAACPSPIVTTVGAIGISATGATLTGSANPNGSAASGYFEYGATASYGSRTPAVSLGAGSVMVAIGGGTLTGLTCGATYHFRADATSAVGTTLGSDAAFSTAACPAPTVTTAAAIGISATGATLNGSANPNGAAATGYFEFGLTPSYGATTSPVSLGAGSAMVAMSGSLTGLACGSTYHFRADAASAMGATPGLDAAFTTASCPAAIVTTGSATAIGVTTATLNGSANPNGNAASGYFEYGLTTSYGVRTPVVSLGSGSVTLAIGSGAVSALTCNTTYHFRADVTTAMGTATGSDTTFRTGACSPIATTGSASGISAAGATLNGSVNPNGTAVSGYFEYGLTTSYGNKTPAVSLGSGSVSLALGSGTVTGLTCGTIYHFRADAASAVSVTSGSDATLTTGACPSLSVTTASASAIGTTGATLNGFANPSGVATSGYFEYGLTASYGSKTPAVALGSGTVAVAIGSGMVSSLACGTTYHFRAGATSAIGTITGLDATFATTACPPPPLAITTPSLWPAATVGTSYSLTLQATGGTAPYIWTVHSSKLPAGLSLNSSTGQVTGVPTTAGSVTVTIRVRDAAQHNFTQQDFTAQVASATTTTVSVSSTTTTSAPSTTTASVTPPATYLVLVPSSPTTSTSSSASSCTYTVSPTSVTVDKNENGGVIRVTTNPGCAWTVRSNAIDWLRVYSAVDRTGSTTIQYGVAANSGLARMGTISIAGQLISVEQR
jgi:hypothetical protein